MVGNNFSYKHIIVFLQIIQNNIIIFLVKHIFGHFSASVVNNNNNITANSYNTVLFSCDVST